MATYSQLKKQIEQLSKQAESARQIEKSATLAKIREAVAAFELTPEEVFGASIKAAKKKAVKSSAAKRHIAGAGQVKYRHPKSGATWTGFGRAPAWLASVRDRTKFLIEQQSAVETQPAEQAPVKPAKAATAKKAASAAKTAPVVKKTEKKKATVAKSAAPVAVKAVAKAPAKKTAKVATAKKPAKALNKPLANAAAAAVKAVTTVKTPQAEVMPQASTQLPV